MIRHLRNVFFYVLPLAINIGLLAYLVWQLLPIPTVERQGGLQLFSVIYALGGIVVVVSGFAAFLHSVLNPGGGGQRLFALSLANIIVPTVLLLVLLWKV